MPEPRGFAPLDHAWSEVLSDRDYHALGLLFARASWRPRTVSRTVARGGKGGRAVPHRKEFVLQPGQLLASERTLAGDWGWSRWRVRRALASLRARGILEVRESLGDAGTIYQLPMRGGTSQKPRPHRGFRAVSTAVAAQRKGRPHQPETATPHQPETLSPSANPSENGGGRAPARNRPAAPPSKKDDKAKPLIKDDFAVPAEPRAREAVAMSVESVLKSVEVGEKLGPEEPRKALDREMLHILADQFGLSVAEVIQMIATPRGGNG